MLLLLSKTGEDSKRGEHQFPFIQLHVLLSALIDGERDQVGGCMRSIYTIVSFRVHVILETGVAHHHCLNGILAWFSSMFIVSPRLSQLS